MKRYNLNRWLHVGGGTVMIGAGVFTAAVKRVG